MGKNYKQRSNLIFYKGGSSMFNYAGIINLILSIGLSLFMLVYVPESYSIVGAFVCTILLSFIMGVFLYFAFNKQQIDKYSDLNK